MLTDQLVPTGNPVSLNVTVYATSVNVTAIVLGLVPLTATVPFPGTPWKY
ncbi:MAG: hypothetical protein QXG65_03650 [Thermoplasmata archaeon]